MDHLKAGRDIAHLYNFYARTQRIKAAKCRSLTRMNQSVAQGMEQSRSNVYYI